MYEWSSEYYNIHMCIQLIRIMVIIHYCDCNYLLRFSTLLCTALIIFNYVTCFKTLRFYCNFMCCIIVLF
jgi:hypothetical protein